MKRLLSVCGLVAMLLVVAVPAVSAQDIDIPINTVVRAPEGSLTLLATVDTPPDLVGANCNGRATAQNQGSVHPGNDLIVETGPTVVVLEDVEGTANKVTTAESPVTLGPTITVTLRMGPDEVFSAGVIVEFELDCSFPTPVIDIEKVANGAFYSQDGVASFTIQVTNPGPVDLFDVVVTDQDALDIDPGSDCARSIGDLAVGESVTYECTVSGLDGVSPFDNEACASGVDEHGTEATDCSEDTQAPPVLSTTVTTSTTSTTTSTTTTTTVAPTTVTSSTVAPTTGETLPVTGADHQDLAVGGALAVLIGLGLLLVTGRLMGRERFDG